jgi:dihydroorotase
VDRITLRRPDDWHLHLRDGAALASVLADSARRFARAIVMPNLKPAVRTTAEALEYRSRILAALPEGMKFEPLMTLYLTDDTPPEEIARAKASGRVFGIKLYPAGATTHSDEGVTRLSRCFHALEKMTELGMPLLVHGESTDPAIDVFDREQAFIEEVLGPTLERFPGLKVVLEHITTREAVHYVEVTGPNVAATITAHHLLLNRNALFLGGIRPHHYCLPVLKRESHREALVEAATSGNPKFFLGTDSAPHARSAKEAACGCAGIYTAHAAIELYAAAFEEAGPDKRRIEPCMARSSRAAAQPGHDHPRARRVARPGAPRLRGRGARPAARGRNGSLEARLAHPAFDAVRPWLAPERSLDSLNALAEKQGLRTESGRPVRFVAPGEKDAHYEIRVYETGRVETRPDSLHDYFNALAWLRSRSPGAHQRNARRRDPRSGRRGRLRDLLTIFDEGGAIVQCDDAEMIALVRSFKWKKLFWQNREHVVNAMRVAVFGHAVLEKALEPWPGVACKVIIAAFDTHPDTAARDWLAALPADASPRLMPPLPIFGFPGWHAENAVAVFYDDTRYFRPLRGER